ncbi:COX15/CtaA family protein [Mesorhizobium koreense]|uniref:COX15/CtaA family protein n=1 Tax=Mesorhizobium koreense TaxID=3074855 RepID=UPI00287B7B47|nr:COX15/CtaA family protein [Mesorhizobium sp. WR6]
MTAATALDATRPSAQEQGRIARNRALVRGWLYVVAVVLFGLFLVGGATRLTNSGLSITEWQPIHGVIPPLNDAEWQEEFAKYKQIPEYKVLNRNMDLAGFKHIFWWEWTHRLIARSVGFIFAIPLILLWVAGCIERKLKPRLVGILALGGLQGAIGWWMVMSGLAHRTDVSQYRLAIHLTTACLIFIATLAVARGLAPHSEKPAPRKLQIFAGVVVALVLFQIYLGALVAGTNAGFSYNTWPLMDGRVVPDGLFVLEPAWRNLFENPKTVQFIHRCGAYLVWIVALAHMIFALSRAPKTTHARRAAVLFLLVTLQAALGITTLLMQVPLDLGLAHQAMALVVLAFATAHWRGTKGAYPVEEAAAARS